MKLTATLDLGDQDKVSIGNSDIAGLLQLTIEDDCQTFFVRLLPCQVRELAGMMLTMTDYMEKAALNEATRPDSD